MTGISLHMQWPLTSQLHGSVSQREQLVFRYGSNSTQKVTDGWHKNLCNKLQSEHNAANKLSRLCLEKEEKIKRAKTEGN
jgi:hypothetical protein